MSFINHWLQNRRWALAPGPCQRNYRRCGTLRAAAYCPCLEGLEDRCLHRFSPVTNFPIGEKPQEVVTADFNNDGNLDLATANNVVLGNGDGTFQPPAL